MAGEAALRNPGGQQPLSATPQHSKSTATLLAVTAAAAARSEQETAKQAYLRQLQNEHPAIVASATFDKIVHGAAAEALQTLCRDRGHLPHEQEASLMMHITSYLQSERPLEGIVRRVLGAGSEGVVMQVTFQEPAVMNITHSSEAGRLLATVRPDMARKCMCYTAPDVLVEDNQSFSDLGLGALSAMGLLPDQRQRPFGVVFPDNISMWPTCDCKQAMLRFMDECGPEVLGDDVWERLDGVPGVVVVLNSKLFGYNLQQHVLKVEHSLEHPSMLGRMALPQLQRRLMGTPLGTHAANVVKLCRLEIQSALSMDMLVHGLHRLHGDLKPENFLTVPGSTPNSKHGDGCLGLHLADLGAARIQAQPPGSEYIYSEGAIMGTLGFMGSGRRSARARGDMRLRQEYEVEAWTGTAIYILLGCSYPQASYLMDTPALWLKVMPDQAVAQQLRANNPDLRELEAATSADAELWLGVLQQIRDQGMAGQAFIAIIEVIAQANLLSRWSVDEKEPVFGTNQLVGLLRRLLDSHIQHLMSLDATQQYVVVPHSKKGVLRAHRQQVLELLDQAVEQPHLLEDLCRHHPDTLEWLQEEADGPCWQSFFEPELLAELQDNLQAWREQQSAPQLLSYQLKELAEAQEAAAGTQAATQVLPAAGQDQFESEPQGFVAAAGMNRMASNLALASQSGRPNVKGLDCHFNSLAVPGSNLHVIGSAWMTEPAVRRQGASTPSSPTSTPLSTDLPAPAPDSSASLLKGHVTPDATPSSPATILQGPASPASTSSVPTMPDAGNSSTQADAQVVACSCERTPDVWRSLGSVPEAQQQGWPSSGSLPGAQQHVCPSSDSVPTTVSTLQRRCSDTLLLDDLSTLQSCVDLATPLRSIVRDTDVKQDSAQDSSSSGAVTETGSYGCSSLTLTSPPALQLESTASLHTELESVAPDTETSPLKPAVSLTDPAKKKKGLYSKLRQWSKNGSSSSSSACAAVGSVLSKVKHQGQRAGQGLTEMWTQVAQCISQAPGELKHEAQRAGLGLTEMWTQLGHCMSQAPAELRHEAQRAGLGLTDMWTQVAHVISQAPRELKHEAQLAGLSITGLWSDLGSVISHMPGKAKRLVVCGAPPRI